MDKQDSPLYVGIIMGSASDFLVMKEAADFLEKFGIRYELNVVSAHRTPEKMYTYATEAQERGLKIIIAGAGGAAHLPGMVASLCTIPVIGVPIKSKNSLDGWDSILSILQMPNGVPVATVGLNCAKNAGILCAQILGTFDEQISEKLKKYKSELEQNVNEATLELEKETAHYTFKK